LIYNNNYSHSQDDSSNVLEYFPHSLDEQSRLLFYNTYSHSLDDNNCLILLLVTGSYKLTSQRGPGCVARRSFATLVDRSSSPGEGNNNVGQSDNNVSDWPTLVISVCYASLVSASADRDFKPRSKCCATINTASPQKRDYHNRSTHYIPIHSHEGSTFPVNNEE